MGELWGSGMVPRTSLDLVGIKGTFSADRGEFFGGLGSRQVRSHAARPRDIVLDRLDTVAMES